ncbi:glutamyl-tRNA reductase [Leptospira idonii]|uniref:Glutamyl-tRNA reductase n=1 Tax=Leptospira idonii TaxID=1193500 RepID=A0A4R9M1H1_9LEPT|nr:glutamyl-tRNA reductase [Leptospira idonii]TGN20553.1 glutamyl-tRNA reductase [Leptospira idonii]
MWANLLVLHNDREDRNKLDLHGFVSWHTCMRSVYISDERVLKEGDLPSDFSGDLYQGYEAYSFLIEVASGLHSKLFGESEIQAQFRDRLKESKLDSSPLSESLKKLRDQVLEHTKQVRSKYLIGLGKQTYGSIAESYLKENKTVSLFGTGKLAESILPYLAKKEKHITVIGRNSDRLKEFQTLYPKIDTCHWEDYSSQTSSAIIASDFFSEEWMQRIQDSDIILDFREGSKPKQSASNARYISFHEILENISETENQISHLKPIVLEFVKELAREREEEQIHLLNGWEDLTCLSN